MEDDKRYDGGITKFKHSCPKCGRSDEVKEVKNYHHCARCRQFFKVNEKRQGESKTVQVSDEWALPTED